MPVRTPSLDAVRRFDSLRQLLAAGDGVTISEAAERLGVSRFAVTRMLQQLEAAGDRMTRVREGRTIRLQIRGPNTDRNLLSAGEIFALELARRALGYLEGTGIKGYLDAMAERFHRSLDRRRLELVKQLEHKIVWIEEAPTRYDDVADTVDAIISGLVKNRALKVTFTKAQKTRRFRLDPYSLLVHKRGLYVIGYSHEHNEQRKFALEAITEADMLEKVTFRYPEDYRPAADFRDTFGIVTGPLADVVVRFDPSVARFVLRRRWHASEQFTTASDGSVELRLRVAGTVELRNALLAYGDKVEVLAPPTFRAEFAAIAARMAERHTPIASDDA